MKQHAGHVIEDRGQHLSVENAFDCFSQSEPECDVLRDQRSGVVA